MNAIIGEMAKGPLPRQERGNNCDDGECNCADCPALLDVELIEARNGNVLSAMLACLVVGIGIGIVVGAVLS
jgi:hypothetical protein